MRGAFMKNWAVCLSIAVILTGCAGTMPEKAELNIEVADQSAGVYPSSLQVSVVGRDNRADPYIIIYNLDKEATTMLPSRVPPQVLVKDSLAQGLRQQGLSRGDRSNITVSVVLKELQAKVSKPGALYTSHARTRLELTIGNNGNVLTLDYNREARKESMTRPKVLFLETMLNEQLTDIVIKILEDQRVRMAIKGKL
jgi:uncharacterized lipoprotein YajG